LDEVFFAFKIPWSDGATKLSLTQGDAELVALQTTGSAPIVRIDDPSAGAKSSGSQTLTWNTISGSPAMHAVQYSPDGGTTWFPLTIDEDSQQFTFNTARIGGGKQVLLRVLASTGFDTGSATIGPIEIIQAPTLSVSPTTIDFSKVVIGASVNRDLKITNTGTGLLRILSATSSNPARNRIGKLPADGAGFADRGTHAFEQRLPEAKHRYSAHCKCGERCRTGHASAGGAGFWKSPQRRDEGSSVGHYQRRAR
jgi:hypothetical protein